jgi:hypothetical protein
VRPSPSTALRQGACYTTLPEPDSKIECTASCPTNFNFLLPPLDPKWLRRMWLLFPQILSDSLVTVLRHGHTTHMPTVTVN